MSATEIQTGTILVTGTEQLVATLLAWHPKVDVYVDPNGQRQLDGSLWRIYAVSDGVEALLAEGVFNGGAFGDPTIGVRVLGGVNGSGQTIELRALSPRAPLPPAPVTAAIVGWDPGVQQTPAQAEASATAPITGSFTDFVTLGGWQPRVDVLVDPANNPRAKGSEWLLCALIAGMTAPCAIAKGAMPDGARSQVVILGAMGGASDWLVRARSRLDTTGPLTASVSGYTPAGEVPPSAIAVENAGVSVPGLFHTLDAQGLASFSDEGGNVAGLLAAGPTVDGDPDVRTITLGANLTGTPTGPNTLRLDAAGGGGVALENAGVPLGGGPFTTLDAQPGVSFADEGGGVASVSSSGGGGGGITTTANYVQPGGALDFSRWIVQDVFGQIWIADEQQGIVRRYDPVSGAETAALDVGARTRVVKRDGSFVYAVSVFDSRLFIIDPSPSPTGPRLVGVAGTGHRMRDLALDGGGGIWVNDVGGGSGGGNTSALVHYNIAAVVAAFPGFGAPDKTFQFAQHFEEIAFGAGFVWATTNATTLFQVDPGTGTPQSFDTATVTLWPVHFAFGSVWTAGRDSVPGRLRVLRFDPGTFPAAPVVVDPNAFDAGFTGTFANIIDDDGTDLWTTTDVATSLLRVDPGTNQVISDPTFPELAQTKFTWGGLAVRVGGPGGMFVTTTDGTAIENVVGGAGAETSSVVVDVADQVIVSVTSTASISALPNPPDAAVFIFQGGYYTVRSVPDALHLGLSPRADLPGSAPGGTTIGQPQPVVPITSPIDAPDDPTVAAILAIRRLLPKNHWSAITAYTAPSLTSAVTLSIVNAFSVFDFDVDDKNIFSLLQGQDPPIQTYDQATGALGTTIPALPTGVADWRTMAFVRSEFGDAVVIGGSSGNGVRFSAAPYAGAGTGILPGITVGNFETDESQAYCIGSDRNLYILGCDQNGNPTTGAIAIPPSPSLDLVGILHQILTRVMPWRANRQGAPNKYYICAFDTSDVPHLLVFDGGSSLKEILTLSGSGAGLSFGLAQDGKYIYVGSWGLSNIRVVDPKTDKEVLGLGAPGAFGIVFDGRFVYSARDAFNNDQVTQLDFIGAAGSTVTHSIAAQVTSTAGGLGGIGHAMRQGIDKDNSAGLDLWVLRGNRTEHVQDLRSPQ